MTDQTAVDRIPIARSVVYAVRGLPDVPNQYGPGVLVPGEITLTYRGAPDSQLGRVHAYVAGRIWVAGKETPLLPGGLYGQHYFDGLDGWPEWLAEEARLHDPDASAVPAGHAPAADQAALRDRIAEALLDHLSRTADIRPGRNGQLAFMPEIDDPERLRIADALLPVLPAPADRAAVLREAADECDTAGAAYTARALNDHAGGAFALMETFLRKANEAEYVATPCDFAGCEPGGEPCSTHERLMAHAEGDHELCAPECRTPDAELRRMAVEAQQPSLAVEDCTCIPFTRQGGVQRYCQPGDTVDMISGWEIGGDCPHHRDAVKAQQPARHIPCPDAFWRPRPHAPHNWQQGPDAQPVHCPGVADTQQPKEA